MHLNGLQGRIQTINCAVGDKDDQILLFHLDQANFGASKVVYSESERTTKVRGSKLDTLLGKDSHLGLIFMDVEGFEGEALKGARGLLEGRPPVAIEFTPKLLAEFTTRDEFCEVFSAYSCFYSLNDPSRKRYLLSELPMVWDWFLREEELEQTDLLFL